jgi:Membrane protein involved in the export of O-antigen and teichoic acid
MHAAHHRQTSRHREGRFTLDWILSNIHTLVTLATGVLAIRLLTQHVSQAEYGFWVMAGSIGGYLLIVQRGTAAALMRASAKAWSRQDREAAERSFHLLLSLLGIYLALGFPVSAAVAWAMGLAYGSTVVALSFWTFFSVCGSMMLGALNAYLGGLGWFAPGRVFLMASAAVNLALTFLCVKLEVALWILAAAQGGATFAMAFAAYVAARWRLRGLFRPTLRVAGVRDTLQLLATGGGFLLADLGFMIAYQSDNILVGAMLGPAQVVPLSLLQRIAGTLQTLLGAQNAPLLPRLMRLHAASELAGIKAIYLTQMRRFAGVAVIFAWGLCCCGRDVVAVWVGPELYAGTMVNLCVAAAFLTVAVYRTAGLVLCAMGEERRCGLHAIAEAVVNVVLSIFLISCMGVAGTVLATTVSQVFVTHLPLAVRLHRNLGLTRREYFASVVQAWLGSFAILAAATPLILLGPPVLVWRVGLAMLAAGMALALGWRIGWRVVPPSTEVS